MARIAAESLSHVKEGVLYPCLWLEASTRPSALWVQRQPVVIRCHSFGELGDGISAIVAMKKQKKNSWQSSHQVVLSSTQEMDKQCMSIESKYQLRPGSDSGLNFLRSENRESPKSKVVFCGPLKPWCEAAQGEPKPAQNPQPRTGQILNASIFFRIWLPGLGYLDFGNFKGDTRQYVAEWQRLGSSVDCWYAAMLISKAGIAW